MAKRSKTDVEGAAAIEKEAKKQKKEKSKAKAGADGKVPAAIAVAAPATFSLFGGKSNPELDDVFNKGAAFAVAPPVQPVASSSRIVEKPVEEVIESASSKKAKSKARRTSEAEQLQAEERLSVPVAAEDEDDEDSEAEVEDDEDTELVHEAAVKGKAKQKKVKAQKYVPENESKEDRDRRTIFVGNLPLEVAKSKSGLSQLRAHILTFASGAKVESARLRSVPFAAPTAASADTEEEGQRRAKREKERARAWKEQQELLKSGDKRDKEEIDTSKTYIDAKGKRRVAFIKKEFHAEADSCNAYVVFAYPPPDRPANLPPILDPFEAATLALKADGSTFLGRMIRVDTARLPSSEALQGATTALKKRDAWTAGSDPKRTAFVGGLDYAAKEEDLRVFFEELIKAERGPREDGSTYVTSVRVVRDKETQMGKGFAYVHFVDTESVDEVLGIDQAKLRFAKKPLRVQRAKTLPSANVVKPATKTATGTTANGAGKNASTTKDKTRKPATAAKPLQSGPIPKGNPLLGEKIKNLSKEERKAAKSADDERQARRLAKKKMRGKMGSEAEKGAVKLHATKGEKARGKKVVAKKSRVRSSNALTKMKGSRA